MIDTDTIISPFVNDERMVVRIKNTEGINNIEVWLYKIVGGGHEWPSEFDDSFIDASEEIWLFFQQYIGSGVENIAEERPDKVDLFVFPNPASEIIEWDVSPENVGSTYILSDTFGRKIFSGKITSTHQIIHVESLVNGEYILQVEKRRVLILLE